MAKDPAFLFYPADASQDVSHMNRLERGCYFDIIQAQKKFNGITTEQARKILGKDFSDCWPAIEMILEEDNGVYFIPWLRESLENRAIFKEKQRKRIQDYWDKKHNVRNNHGNTTVLPVENENENENPSLREGINSKYGKGEISRLKSTIEDRIQDFMDEVGTFKAVYPDTTLRAFFNYWSEPNPSKTKFRKELEKTWDTSRRLVTWVSREKTSHNGKRPNVTTDDIERITAAYFPE